MRVKDVMTTPVLTVSAKATIAEAITLMGRSRVSGLPVVDPAGCVVGVLSEGDLLRRIELGTQKPKAHWLECLFHPGKLALAYTQTHGRKVEEIMSTDVCSIDENALLEQAVAVMEERHVKRLPVMSKGKLVGIISRADFMRALASFVSPTYEEQATSDAEIATRILGEIKAQSWAPEMSIDVRVKDGVVQLHGSIFDERQRDAIRVAAENVVGVRAVHDHLVWIDTLGTVAMLSPEDTAQQATSRAVQ